MAYISRSEFLKMQENKEAKSNVNPGNFVRSNVGFFGLKNDGDTAIVRFACASPEDFEVYTVHPFHNMFGRKFGNVNCISEPGSDHECPFCKAGASLKQRFFIKLVQYDRDENDDIVASAKVWDRPTSYCGMLANLYEEYGDLTKSIFKIKRNGKAGSQDTTYSIMYCSPNVYNDQLYKRDFSEFDNYKLIGSMIVDKNETELSAEVGNIDPQDKYTPKTKAPVAVESTETYTPTPQPRRVSY